MGKDATPALLIVALPSGAGVSLSWPRAFTNPASRVTAVSLPDRAGICATGVGAALADAVVGSSEPPQAVAPSARAAVAARAVRVLECISSLAFRRVGEEVSRVLLRTSARSGCLLPVRVGAYL